ncbi:MAG: multicopper oxidase domain-containing protein [Paludibacteraceae bacterium]|nr:multicopper oxidase domain-containing protein [Paludibacteraceae bacterium]
MNAIYCLYTIVWVLHCHICSHIRMGMDITFVNIP